MENAADALKMAGAVLIFVLSISIIIFAFSQARETSDTILNYRDRETMYVESDYYYTSDGKERIVNLETIIPTIFRAYLENYKIVFEGLSTPIYKIKNREGTIVDKYTIDLERNLKRIYPNANLANNEEKAEFLRGILYHDYNNNVNAFQNKYFVTMTDESLYGQLTKAVNSGKKIKEYIGVYYQDDNPNEPETNKDEKRIITYKVE